MVIFLLHLTIGYVDSYFKFESLESLLTFVSHVKFAFVNELSDHYPPKVNIEVMTNDEYKEKIDKAKGE